MKIHRNQIPDEGLHVEGCIALEEADYVDLAGEDIRQAGPLRYDLQVGQHGSGVWAAGSIAVDVEQTCVRCLGRFVMSIEIPEFAVQKEAGGRESVDLTLDMREDILLALPANPDCDRHGGLECSGPGHLLNTKIYPNAPGDSEGGLDQETPNPWAGLDELKIEPKRRG